MMDEDVNEDDSSIPDSSDDDEEQKMELRAKELESHLLENKYNYNMHMELIGLYDRLADLNSLRASYQRFHECFPLTSQIWMKWIKIEIKVGSSDREKQHILELFDKATGDYLSCKLWQEYAQYVMEVSNLESTKTLLERALSSVGLHVTEGSLLWDFLREIELTSISVISKDSDDWKEQVMRVIEVFRRQLSVPLLEMENTYNEWQEWQKSLPEDFNTYKQQVEWNYQKALKLLETFKPFEEELLVCQDDKQKYEIYQKYIKVVKDPSTVICLFERAVSELCLNPQLWLDYCEYALKLGDVALKICEKSLRNCTWSEELWIMKLTILEKLNKNEDEIMSSFEQGLSNISPSPGLQLWFSYIEYVKRNSKDREKLNKLLEQACEKIGDFDSNYSLLRFHGRILAKDGNIKDATGVWNKIFENPENKANLTLWLEFISLVKQFGDIKQTRLLYERALKSCIDWRHYIKEEWLMFEREIGTLDDVLKLREKCKKYDTPLEISHTSQNYQEHSYKKNEMPENKTGRKRKFDENFVDNHKKFKKDVKETIMPVKLIEKDPTKTVFISNIAYNVNENMLKTMFPNAENINVMRDKKGHSRLFAYVQFRMEEEVMSALARDREPLDGRPVFISSCNPDKTHRKPILKYSTEPDDSKLFVRGLSKSCTEQEVSDIFKPYGAINTRLVVYKSGQSKGLAFIEFPNPESAKKALESTDQMVIAGQPISVALSAPPPKKVGFQKVEEPLRHSRSRLQIPMIPRAVVQAKNDKNSNDSGNSNMQKSNDDFRKMLLMKKP